MASDRLGDRPLAIDKNAPPALVRLPPRSSLGPGAVPFREGDPMMRSNTAQINPQTTINPDPPTPITPISMIEIDPDTLTCPDCEGEGSLEVHLGFGDLEEHDCLRCLGLGQLPGDEYSFEELCHLSLEEDGDMFIGAVQVTPPRQFPLVFAAADVPDFSGVV